MMMKWLVVSTIFLFSSPIWAEEPRQSESPDTPEPQTQYFDLFGRETSTKTVNVAGSMPAGELKVPVVRPQPRKTSRSRAKSKSSGRYVITSVRKSSPSKKKPQLEVRWINGKRVICLKK